MGTQKTEAENALAVQQRALAAINKTLQILAETETSEFPNYPLMIPTL